MLGKRIALAAFVVCLTTLSAGIHALLASNVGFLVNCPLHATGPISRNGFHTLNLPYQRDAQLVNGSDIQRDLGIVNVGNVQKFLEGSDGLQLYTGRKGMWPPVSSPEIEPASPGLDFALSPGECYFVQMQTTVNYVIGGSSDSSVALSLDAAGPGSLSGLNFVSLPYHITAGTASELMQDIGLPSVANVQRFLALTNGLQVYTGRKGSPSADFNLDPCECYFIKMNTTVNYIPSHY